MTAFTFLNSRYELLLLETKDFGFFHVGSELSKLYILIRKKKVWLYL